MTALRLPSVRRSAHLGPHSRLVVIDGLILSSVSRHDALTSHLHLVVLPCDAALRPFVRALVGPGFETRMTRVRWKPIFIDLSDARSHSFIR